MGSTSYYPPEMVPLGRFFIDERGGCAAVRDRTKTNPDDQGLHPETAGVVKYWSGTRKRESCPTCGQSRHAGWDLPEGWRAEAEELCKRLGGVVDYQI